MRKWSRPANFDAAGRHSLASYVRLAESHAVKDGDLLTVRLRNGKVQPIEGDRIKNPSGSGAATVRPLADGEEWVDGVRVGPERQGAGGTRCTAAPGGAWSSSGK